MINMGNMSFRVLDMNSSGYTRTIVVARDDYSGTLCPSSYVSIYNCKYSSPLATPTATLILIILCSVTDPSDPGMLSTYTYFHKLKIFFPLSRERTLKISLFYLQICYHSMLS